MGRGIKPLPGEREFSRTSARPQQANTQAGRLVVWRCVCGGGVPVYLLQGWT